MCIKSPDFKGKEKPIPTHTDHHETNKTSSHSSPLLINVKFVTRQFVNINHHEEKKKPNRTKASKPRDHNKPMKTKQPQTRTHHQCECLTVDLAITSSHYQNPPPSVLTCDPSQYVGWLAREERERERERCSKNLPAKKKGRIKKTKAAIFYLFIFFF